MKAKPLAGIRILEIGAYISAPYAGMILESLGAEVVKIEPLDGEAFRRGEDNRSPYFIQYNTGKKSVALNLKSRSGLDAIKDLIPRFDVLIENMRPGKMAALQLGEAECRKLNPQLIYTSISGFGSGGPWVSRPAYDTIGQSMGGIYSIMNEANNRRLTGTCIADLITGINSAMGILAALLGRERHQEKTGTLVETSLIEAISTLTIDAMTQAFDTGEDPERSTRHPHAQNFCLQTADGGGITLHLSVSQKFWAALATVIGREDLMHEPRFATYNSRRVPEHYEELVQIMTAAFALRPRSEWEYLLTAADVPFAPVLSMHEVAEHEQTKWLELHGPNVGNLPMVRLPWRFDGERPTRSAHPAHVGQHTRDILREIYSDEQIDQLIANNNAFAAPAAQ